MADSPTKTVPLIPSHALTEFGAVETSAVFSDPTIMDRDHSYVPGWSDLRRQRDGQLAEVVAGKRAANTVMTLPVNLRWARNQDKTGSPDSSKVFGHGRKGYRLVDANKDKKEPWFTALPPGTTVAADGSIRNGDTVLMVATAADAGRSALAKQMETERRVTGAVNTFAQNVERAGGIPKGADPTITKLPSAAQ